MPEESDDRASPGSLVVRRAGIDHFGRHSRRFLISLNRGRDRDSTDPELTAIEDGESVLSDRGPGLVPPAAASGWRAGRLLERFERRRST